MSIFISGSIARDIIMDYPGRFAEQIDPKKIHVLSLSFAVDNLKENYGGTAANICYNLALLGEKPEIIGSVGKDGTDIKKYLSALGVGTKYLGISKNKRTAAAYIITDRDDNQIAGFHAGATIVPVRLPRIRSGDWALISPDPPHNMIKLAKYYAGKRIDYIFDPGQRITSLANSELRIAIRGARILIGNDYEIGMIQKNFSPVIRGRLSGGRLTLIRTLGPKGSEIIAGNRKIKIGIAKPRRVVDPTGAGDAYRAGLLKGLILGYDLERCGELGAAVASFAVEEYGTQNHKFTWKELMGRL